MTQKREGPASMAIDPGPDATPQGSAKPSATPRKWQRVLKALLEGRSLNRFEAARELRDWCLNTTISQLERRGVIILRHDESVPGAFGDVHCCRYWLSPHSAQRAAELLGPGGGA